MISVHSSWHVKCLGEIRRESLTGTLLAGRMRLPGWLFLYAVPYELLNLEVRKLEGEVSSPCPTCLSGVTSYSYPTQDVPESSPTSRQHEPTMPRIALMVQPLHVSSQTQADLLAKNERRSNSANEELQLRVQPRKLRRPSCVRIRSTM
jgi:hypothetical protein